MYIFKIATYFNRCSVPDNHFVSRVQQVLDNAAAHDAKPEKTKLHLARLDVFLQ